MFPLMFPLLLLRSVRTEAGESSRKRSRLSRVRSFGTLRLETMGVASSCSSIFDCVFDCVCVCAFDCVCVCVCDAIIVVPSNTTTRWAHGNVMLYTIMEYGIYFHINIRASSTSTVIFYRWRLGLMDACVDCFFRVLLLFLPVGGSQSVQCTVHDGSGRHHYYFMPDESSSDLREFFGWRKVSVQSRVDSCNSPNLHATKEFESYNNRKIFLCCLICLVLVLAPHHQSQHHHGDPYFIDSSIVLLFLVRTLVLMYYCYYYYYHQNTVTSYSISRLSTKNLFSGICFCLGPQLGSNPFTAKQWTRTERKIGIIPIHE